MRVPASSACCISNGSSCFKPAPAARVLGVSRDDHDVRERRDLVGLRVGDSMPSTDATSRLSSAMAAADRRRYTLDVSAERGVSRLLVRAAEGHGGVVVGARRRIVARNVLRALPYEKHGIAGLERMPRRYSWRAFSRFFCAR